MNKKAHMNELFSFSGFSNSSLSIVYLRSTYYVLMQSPDISSADENEIKLYEALPQLLNEDVLSVERILEGEVNYVYTVELRTRKVVVKIFSNSHSPKPGKNRWVDQLLKSHNIPYPALLFYARNDTYFPYGLAVFEYIPGRNAKHAIEAGTLSEETFARSQGKLLRRVHSIKLDHYGFDKDERFLDFILHPVLKASRDQTLAEPNLQRAIAIGTDILDRVMQKYHYRLTPVLVHGDCEAKNTIINASSGNVLVDWDNCGGNIWMRDLACLLFRKVNEQVTKQKMDQFQQAFFQGYGLPEDFSPEEIAEILHVLHIRRAVELITYYLARNNLPKHEEMKQLLFRLIA